MEKDVKNLKENIFSIGDSDGPLHSGADGSNNASRSRGRSLTVMERLFKDKGRAFWIFQLFGWTGYFILRIFTALTYGFEFTEYASKAFLLMLVGVGLSLVMRYIYRRCRAKPLPIVSLTAVITSVLFGVLFSFIEVKYITIEESGGLGMLSNAMFESTALFAWSTLYFSFHYYNDLQEQRAKALAAVAMAHQAQLKMLRYQLNPHFLFNTLNAISTLVLEKDTVSANKMLTKLSSFLRYTLVNQPTQKVSLEQEIYTLQLYLEIERVRFEDRLTVEFDVEDIAMAALIPSLILQPHVENAIKYAIAPALDGGTLKIHARKDGKNLVISLEDDGPGMDDPDKPISTSSSGVGIINTRDRLNQIYGENHTFFIQNIEPRGLRVWMKIPFETKENEQVKK